VSQQVHCHEKILQDHSSSIWVVFFSFSQFGGGGFAWWATYATAMETLVRIPQHAGSSFSAECDRQQPVAGPLIHSPRPQGFPQVIAPFGTPCSL
jgi:hypothetical protein